MQVAGGEEVVACVEGGASVAEAVAKFGKVSSSLHNQHFNFSLLSFPLVKNTLKKVTLSSMMGNSTPNEMEQALGSHKQPAMPASLWPM